MDVTPEETKEKTAAKRFFFLAFIPETDFDKIEPETWELFEKKWFDPMWKYNMSDGFSQS